MRSRRWAAVGAASALIVGLLVAGGALRRADHADASEAATPGTHDVIVHLFEWPWASVAKECTTVLGPKGFGGVQVSPPQEHIEAGGHPWWQDYQPVSYKIESRRGNRADFASMVSTCHAAGVKIYVDAVINHMSGGSSGTGSAGSVYSHYSYAAVPYGTGDFHHCGLNGNDDIVNYTTRNEVQNCELVNLADLKTESSYVRGKIDGYLNDLVSLGVDGFRVDAAKHIPAADMQAIADGVTGDPYFYQEVTEGGANEPGPDEYTAIGDVTEFRYGSVVGAAFRDSKLSGLQNLPSQMRLKSADAVAFIDNHDTQRDGRAILTYKSGTTYALAEAFMIAYPYGVPQVMSSFDFTTSSSSPPSAADGTTSAVTCGSGWVCEHRKRTTENMVAVRNTAAGQAVTNWWSNGSGQIAFGRGSAAFVAFNRSGSALTRSFQTSLAAGTYCDVMSGDFSNGTCTGTSYAVNASGQVSLTVPANGVVALHTGARNGAAAPATSATTAPPTTTACSTSAVTFKATVTTVWGQNVFVTGNTAALGNWDPAKAVALSSAAYPVWTGTANLPAGQNVQYKYIKKEGSTVTWLSGANLARTTAAAAPCSATWTDTWR